MYKSANLIAEKCIANISLPQYRLVTRVEANN